MAKSYLDELFGLDGQVAVVIGGTGELGGAIAEGLGRAGAKIVVAGRGEDRGVARAKKIEDAGGVASFASVDACSRTSIEALLATTLDRYGRVDILVNSAGVNAANDYLEIKDEDWDRVVEANLKATHLGCQIFGEHLVKQESGAILNIGSANVDIPLSRVFAYSAAKAAVANLTKNVAREFAPKNVRVNCLCPGFFPAEQNRKILKPERIASIMQQTPMARFGKSEELVGAAILMVAPIAGSFITGAVYYVDGGFTSMRF